MNLIKVDKNKPYEQVRKTAKNWCKAVKIISKILFVCSIIGCAFMLLGAIATASDGSFLTTEVDDPNNAGAKTTLLALMGMSSVSQVTGILFDGALILLFSSVLLKIIANIFENAEKNAVPFDFKQVERIKLLGFVFLVALIVCTIAFSAISSATKLTDEILTQPFSIIEPIFAYAIAYAIEFYLRHQQKYVENGGQMAEEELKKIQNEEIPMLKDTTSLEDQINNK